jgi:hypothetical protein
MPHAKKKPPVLPKPVVLESKLTEYLETLALIGQMDEGWCKEALVEQATYEGQRIAKIESERRN